MNIKEYLANPMGKGSSVLMLSEIRKSLDRKYDEIKSRIRLKWYELNEKYYVAHLKIPSRTHDKVFYDVLLQFDIETVKSGTSMIHDANVRVFSNCPSFTYTYANTFRKKNDLIEWSRSKYKKEIFEKDPVIRNPDQIRSYEKSLYFAFKYVLSNGRYYTGNIKMTSTSVKSYKHILANVRTNTEIEDLYKSYSDKARKQNAIDKRNESGKEKKTNQTNSSKRKNGVKTTKHVSSVKNTKKTSKTKKI